MIAIDALTLEALVNRAGREAPITQMERRAEEDARELLREDFAAQFPVNSAPSLADPNAAEFDPLPGGYYQPTLFDPKPYA